MGSITIDIDSKAILKACEWIAVILAIGFVCFYAGTAIYNTGKADAATPTTAPVYVTPNQPATIYVTPQPTLTYVFPSPTIDYITDVQSIGTEWGYVCMVDGNGQEYLIMNFDQNTAQLLHASYSGTVTGSYNGIPELENVALTGYPHYYYTPINRPNVPDNHYRETDIDNGWFNGRKY
jgi:hypothetical protein